MRRREREVTDRNEILNILDKSLIVHLGLCEADGMPYVVPMNYGYCFQEDHLVIYVHGATSGHMYDVIHENSRVSFEMECDVLPFSGSVACKYGMAYSCIMGRGTARILTDEEDSQEKQDALTLLMKAQTGRDDFSFNEKLAAVVNVVRIDVTDYTAKKRPLPAS
jgi:nitroimidazol reductase NimA-like FMN-containing flavoprotein (pyridoxamine 5'-phosphate oxidase superfamily)